MVLVPALDVLPRETWQAREQDHRDAVRERTRDHLARRDRGEKHPVEDFLWEYYSLSPGRLARWHPGVGVGLADADRMPRASWRFYRTERGVVSVDVEAFVAARHRSITFVRDLVTATLSRPPSWGCFALHEWAMVYDLPAERVRHPSLPLRLGPDGTDEVVRTHPIRCTHFDAYRFFTPAAAPLNAWQPTRERQLELDQPGCLHAGMDLYKWCFTLAPVVPSSLTLAAFDLAREIRRLDMAASPYDVRGYGIEPVPVETAEGKAVYVEAQRAFADQSSQLRRRLLALLEPVLEART